MKLKTSLFCILTVTFAWVVSNAKEIPHSFTQPKTGWYFSVGPRFVSSGASAKFENLGTVPEVHSPSLDVGANRQYDDGFVNADAERAAESDPTTTTSGGRYQTFDENNVQTGDFLSFDPAQTRNWGYNDAGQVSGGNINMNTYSSVSEGASADEDSSLAGGFEMQFSKVIFKVNPRVTVGMMGSFGLTDISVKSSGRIAATLNTRTDAYSLLGASAPAAPYSGPTFTDFDDGNGNVTPSGLETTTPISQEPVSTSNSTSAGAATVDGTWEVNGAYTSLRFGSVVHFRLDEMFQFSFSAGVSGHFAGTRFKYREQLVDLPTSVSSAVEISNESDDSSTEFLFGYFIEANVESWLNEKTGFFLGVHYEKNGDYEQELDGRIARIDLGGSAGLRSGLIFRF